MKKIHQEATKGEKWDHINKLPTLNPRVHVSGEGKQSTLVDLNERGNSVVLSSINALVGYNRFLNFTTRLNERLISLSAEKVPSTHLLLDTHTELMHLFQGLVHSYIVYS